ncbi:tetratricopeptide repeat protein [Bradymonas sediminis]|uniref:Uncharacterized protein n=1 Tax=Bradymonas sediminis TaxID=1548548 RepID=A0A2Z4FM09_9DELT|nr:tetratricopeptide repeat protein [Bradymonas sediminis]AWV89845.1 hypothetical protein DN745_11040 [Bradymonas sediminis]TDP76406.1 tetratricopeptide repeat protein [Bradymonas sediminis]
MKLTPYLLAACLLASTLGSACSSTPDTSEDAETREKKAALPEQSAQELFLQGNQKMDVRDFEGAVALYDQALKVDPKRWDIYMNKGIAHSSMQQFSEAVNAMDAALTNGGDAHAEVYFNLGNIYQNRGLYAQSIKAYRSSLTLRERPHVDTILNIAAGLMFMRETDKAQETYEYLQTLAPDDARIYMGMGLLEQMRDNLEGAHAHFDRAIQMAPDYAHPYFMKGSLYGNTSKNKEGVEFLERYLELEPNGPYAKMAKTRIKSMKKKM